MPTDTSNDCINLEVSKQDLSITFPGGAEMHVHVPFHFPDQMAIAKQAMAQASAVLAPLVPIFNIIDVAIAIVTTVKAIPDAISHLNPSKVTSTLSDLSTKAAKLLKLVPQASVPLMILGLIDVLLAYLDGLTKQVKAIIDQQGRIQQAANRAAELANVELQGIVDCANKSIAAQMQDLSAGMGPVNRFIALMNLFLGLIGQSPIPDLSALKPDAQEAIKPIEETVQKLKEIRASIPV